MLYKIGDKVTIRSDLKYRERCKTEVEGEMDGVALEMVDFAGKEVTIYRYYGKTGYLIKEDDHHYSWCVGMFEINNENEVI